MLTMFHSPKRWLSVLAISLAVLACGAFLLSDGALADKGGNKGGGKGGGGGGGDGSGSSGYVVVDLSGPVALAARANAVNDFGEVVGSIDNHPTYWQVDAQGNVETVLLPEDFSSSASDINNFGEAVGGAALWIITDAGVSVVELPPLPGDTFSYAEAISDTGVIVGRSQGLDADGGSLGQSAVVWQVDDLNEVHVFELAEPNVNNLVVNNLGQVAARVDGLGAVIWNLEFDTDGIVVGASEPIALSNPFGGGPTGVGSINDLGWVSGSAALDLTGDESHAVVWEIDADGSVLGITDLGILQGDDRAGASGLNSARQVVGNSCRFAGGKGVPKINCVAFLWENEQMLDVNSLLADTDGFKKLEGAFGINEAGWICGHGEKNRERHAFVAIPLP